VRDPLPQATRRAELSRPLVIGLGDPSRGDDAVGPWLARRIGRRVGAGVRVSSGDALDLLACWEGWPRVFVLDASRGGGAPGAVHRFEARDAVWPAQLAHASTHGWGLAQAVELARQTGRLPGNLVIYAIEGASFELGQPMSRAVRRAAERVEKALVAELGRYFVPEAAR